MTNDEPKIIGLAKQLKDNPILKQICERVAYADSDSHLGELIADARLDTDAANFASNIPALAESLILAYEALEYGKVMMKDDITIVPTDPPRECMWFTYKAIDEALSRISSLPA